MVASLRRASASAHRPPNPAIAASRWAKQPLDTRRYLRDVDLRHAAGAIPDDSGMPGARQPEVGLPRLTTHGVRHTSAVLCSPTAWRQGRPPSASAR